MTKPMKAAPMTRPTIIAAAIPTTAALLIFPDESAVADGVDPRLVVDEIAVDDLLNVAAVRTVGVVLSVTADADDVLFTTRIRDSTHWNTNREGTNRRRSGSCRSHRS